MATIIYPTVRAVSGFNPADGSYTSIGAPGSFLGFGLGDEPGNSGGDGQEAQGDLAYEYGSTFGTMATHEYTGWTINGDPVFYSGGVYELMVTPEAPALSAADIAGGVAIATPVYAYCFVKGTAIRTPAGDVPVESLNIGDPVLNNRGQAVAVKWIGRQTRNPVFAHLLGQMPVRIAAGALGHGLPRRDLFVSPDHALLVDGVLAHAQALVNGRTIVQMQDWQGDVEYFHIETEAHDLILAEATPAETFIDNVARQQFDNHAEYTELYPNALPMVELDLPRVKFARQLPRKISRRLDAVADVLLGAEHQSPFFKIRRFFAR